MFLRKWVGIEHDAEIASVKRPARILFFGEAVTVTHVGRMMVMASGLDRSKYTPLLAWDPRFNRILGPLPGPFFPAFTIPTERFLSRIRSGRPVYDFSTLERYIHWDLEILREACPDVVVGDYRLSLAISAYVAGIPYINVINAHWSPYASPRFTVPDTPFARVFGASVAQVFFDLMRPVIFLAYALDFNRLAVKFGRPSYGRDLRKIYCDGDRTLYPDLPEITPIDGAPATHRYLGPVVWSPPIARPAILDTLPAGKPLVYVNLGTSGDPRALPSILDALATRPVQVLAATGGRSSPGLKNADIHLVDFLPGDDVCRVADLVINNGGSAGVQQALLAGVPVLGIPSNLDQYLNMQFIERAGVGKTLRGDHATTRRVGKAVDDLLNDARYRAGAQSIGEIARAWQPVRIMEAVIDELIENPPRVPSPLFPFRGDLSAQKQWSLPSTKGTLEWAKAMTAAARCAPSTGNSQPLRYVWDGEWLRVHLLPDRASPFLNFITPDTWINAGAALENMAVTAASRGEGLDIDLVTQDTRDGLITRVRAALSRTNTAEDPALAAFIGERCTNRGAYDTQAIPAQIRERLMSIADSAKDQVVMEWLGDPDALARAADALSIYHQIVFEIPGLRLALAKWIRTPQEAKKTNDGLARDTLALSPALQFVFRMSLSPWLAPVLARIGYFRLYRRMVARGFRRSGALVFFSVAGDSPSGFIEAGRAIERFWLRAAQCGIAAQPMAGATYLWQRQKYLAIGLSPLHRRMTEQCMETLHSIGPQYLQTFPILVFRIGYAPAPAARSSRLPFDQIFEDRSAG